MSDNPFLEPNDNERTILQRPVPGGRPPPVQPPPVQPPPFQQPLYQPPTPQQDLPPPQPPGPAASAEPLDRLVTGRSALVDAATPLLQLLGRLRNTYNPPDPGALRVRTIEAIRAFESAGRAAGVPHEVLHPARYALCASIDDVVMHTPWGAASTWVQASLVSTFHQEVIAGEGFFHQLATLKRDPARNLMLLELMYFCLSLGYQGQYRLSRQGPAQLEQLREDLYQTLKRLRPAYEQSLSPRWQGVLAAYRPARAVVPVWVMALVALLMVTAGWLFFSERLSAASDGALEVAANMPPTRMPLLDHLDPPPDRTPPQPAVARPPPPPPPPPSAAFARLSAIGDPRIQLVLETPQLVQVRIFSSGMFALGSATVRPEFVALLERIGDALNAEPGAVLVTGHTDDLPIHSVQFPSNYELSVARAKAASAIILRHLTDPRRLTSEGRADLENIQPNDTDDHRAQNRRIDLILQRTS